MMRGALFFSLFISLIAALAIGARAAGATVRAHASSVGDSVELTSPINNAVISGIISISCSVSSNVEYINLDVDNNYYSSGPAYATSYTASWNSESVTNGSHSIECNGYASSGSLVGSGTASITVSNGTLTTPLAPTPTPTRGSTPRPTALPTSLPTRTLSPSASPTAAPASVSPLAYGAVGDCFTDDTAAFQGAINTGRNVVVPMPPGGVCYLIHGTLTMESNQEFSCTSTAVRLYTDLHNGDETAILHFLRVQHSGVDHCGFEGANTSVPAVLDNNQWNYLVWISGPSSYISVTYNDFANSWANGALRCDGNEGEPNIPSTNVIWSNNTYKNNAYYGSVTISCDYVTQTNETMIDSSCCAEPNSAVTDSNFNNTYNNIFITEINGNHATCTSECQNGVFLTGGTAPDDFNFASDLIENSTISGKNMYLVKQAPSGGEPADYSNITCENGASGC